MEEKRNCVIFKFKATDKPAKENRGKELLFQIQHAFLVRWLLN